MKARKLDEFKRNLNQYKSPRVNTAKEEEIRKTSSCPINPVKVETRQSMSRANGNRRTRWNPVPTKTIVSGQTQ